MGIKSKEETLQHLKRCSVSTGTDRRCKGDGKILPVSGSGHEFYIELTDLRTLWDSMLLKGSGNLATSKRARVSAVLGQLITAERPRPLGVHQNFFFRLSRVVCL